MQVVAINRRKGQAIFFDGEKSFTVQLDNFVDRFGEDADDAFEAVTAVAKMPNGRWVVIDLTEFKDIVRN